MQHEEDDRLPSPEEEGKSLEEIEKELLAKLPKPPGKGLEHSLSALAIVSLIGLGLGLPLLAASTTTCGATVSARVEWEKQKRLLQSELREYESRRESVAREENSASESPAAEAEAKDE